MSLDADVRLRLGPLDLAVAVEAGPGQVVAVLGPNGAGKTTLLRALAGLVALEAGRIALDGRVLDDPARGRFVVPEDRSVGVVFQDHLLFPHLDATDNVAFGLRARGTPRGQARAVAAGWLADLGLGALARAKPSQLSGGQAQRVALARGLAPAPALLLLDEPLAALDAGTRVEVRRQLRRHLAERAGPTVLVTHDPVDALALAARAVVVEGGRVVQAGPVAEVAARPRSPYVADLLGVNLLPGRGEGPTVRLAGGGHLAVAEPVHGDVLVLVAPRAVSLHRRQPDGSPRNRWEGTVDGLELVGQRVRVRLVAEGRPPIVAEVTPAAVAELGLHEGAPAWAAVKATEVEAYPA